VRCAWCTIDSINCKELIMNMVWHYAPWAYLPAMVESGALRGSNTGAEGEAPMLWFSANQQWEPTATKMIRNSAGATVSMTFKQQVQMVGCIRFGMGADDCRLLDWKAACAFAGTPRDSRRAIRTVLGKRRGQTLRTGSQPLRPSPLAELHFQVWADGWRDATSPQDMAAVWVEKQAA